MRLLTLAILAALTIPVLSGCTDKNAQTYDEVPATSGIVEDPETGELLFVKPNLTQGRWWDVHVGVNFDFGMIFDQVGKLVVSSKDDEGFTLGSDNREINVLDSYFDSFYIGRLDHDLNPTIGGVNAKFFQWPLKENQTWTSPFIRQGFDGFGDDGVTADFNVTTFEESPNRLRIQGLTSAGERLDYDYDAATGWMTYFRMVNQTGRIIVALDFLGTGEGFTGTIHHLTADVMLEKFFMIPPFGDAVLFLDPGNAPFPPAETFTVSDGYTFVEEIEFLFTFPLCTKDFDPNLPAACAGGGASTLTIVRPDGSNDPTTHTGAGDQFEGSLERTIVEQGFKGDWKVAYTAAGTAGAFILITAFKDDVKTL